MSWPPRVEDFDLRQYSGDERRFIRVLIERVVWLSVLIERDHAEGKPLHCKRLERKATRFALLELGVELPPNPIIVGVNDQPSRRRKPLPSRAA